MFGYAPSEIIGQDISLLLNPVPAVPRLETLLEQGLNRIAEQEARRKNQEVFPIEMTISNFEGGDGCRYLVNVLDLTERREIERMRRDFVAMVSHDLRTPLTSIRGGLALLDSDACGPIPSKAKDMIKTAARNTDRLLLLINDLLDMEKLESGNLELSLENVSVRDLVHSSVDAVSSFAQQHGVTIQWQSTVSANLYLLGDRERLIQVMVNLLSNAIKFSAGGGQVYVEAAADGECVELSVRDEGPGIASEHQHLIFHKFKQLPAESTVQKGSGLGLAICKAIVDSHQGEIGLESQIGRGCRFWFRIKEAAVIETRKSESKPELV